MEAKTCVITDYQEQERLFPFQLVTIKSKLQDKHKLVIPKNCDDFLLRCLRLKDGNLEKAIKLILSFYNATADFQHWNATIQPSHYKDLYEAIPLLPLNKRDSLGRRVFILRPAIWPPARYNFDEAFACVWMMAQFLNAEFLDTQRDGYVTIWDCENFSMRHALAVNHWRLLSLAKWAQNGVMGRIKAFHIINYPKVVSMIYSGIKPFLKEKLKKRVMFHSDLNSMYEHVDESILPTFLGGSINYEDCIDRDFINNLIQYNTYFKEMMANRLPNK